MRSDLSESFSLINIREAHISLNVVSPGQACGMLV